MYSFAKRIMDILLAGIATVILAPVIIVLCISIKLTSKGPIIFKQKRIGKDKKHFYILKFRTMYADTPSEVPTHLLSNQHKHITPLGQVLRRTSLDELPQLWNIIKGDMSIVGPRPALWNQYDLIAERDRYGANAVRPGLTGLAQINGRDDLPIDRKAAYDGEYSSEIGFVKDCLIILRTITYVVSGKDMQENKKQ